MSDQPLAGLLGLAATILAGDISADDVADQGQAIDLLRRLDYIDGPRHEMAHRAALLRAAARFHRIFSLPAEDAPGLVVLGAEADAGCLGVAEAPLGGVSGTGLSFRQAFESCVGEGAEYVSGFATPDDTLVSLAAAEALADATPAMRTLWARLQTFRRDPMSARIDWLIAANPCRWFAGLPAG